MIDEDGIDKGACVYKGKLRWTNSAFLVHILVCTIKISMYAVKLLRMNCLKFNAVPVIFYQFSLFVLHCVSVNHYGTC